MQLFRSTWVKIAWCATELISPGKVAWLNCQQSRAVRTSQPSTQLAKVLPAPCTGCMGNVPLDTLASGQGI